ncbi:MAG: glycosyltransferase [Sediminibacterium sp.]
MKNVRQNIKILVAPLDWGLGHATRCIPIIRSLLEAGHEVVLAGEEKQAILLREEFPQLTVLPLPGYRITYSKNHWQLPFKLAAQLPKIFRAIRHERKWLKKQIEKKAFDLVISDNRYGLYHPSIPSIIITHQLTIVTPFCIGQNWLQRIHYTLLNRFLQIWVPDTAYPPHAAGILSHPKKTPATPLHYIGWLSRFEPVKTPATYTYCILLSGPEPQRTLLEQKLIGELQQVKEKVLFIRGLPGEQTLPDFPNNINCKNHLSGKALQEALHASEWVISRSGYTTVMEILHLQKKAILIPTPGQTEQIYLAKKLLDQQWAFSVEQEKFNFNDAVAAARQFHFSPPPNIVYDQQLCLSQIQKLMHPDVALRQ